MSKEQEHKGYRAEGRGPEFVAFLSSVDVAAYCTEVLTQRGGRGSGPAGRPLLSPTQGDATRP